MNCLFMHHIVPLAGAVIEKAYILCILLFNAIRQYFQHLFLYQLYCIRIKDNVHLSAIQTLIQHYIRQRA